jgi:hypothetical protein
MFVDQKCLLIKCLSIKNVCRSKMFVDQMVSIKRCETTFFNWKKISPWNKLECLSIHPSLILAIKVRSLPLGWRPIDTQILDSGACTIKLLRSQFMDFHNKLGCFSRQTFLARSNVWGWGTLEWSTRKVLHSVGSGLTHKQTRLERLARDKHSSLLRKCVNYGRKKFYSGL